MYRKIPFLLMGLLLSGCASTTPESSTPSKSLEIAKKREQFKQHSIRYPARCDSEFSRAQNINYKSTTPIQVKYPIRAVRDKIEGFVTIEFDLNESGTPINMNVIESYPERIFDKESKRTLEKMTFQLAPGKMTEDRSCLQIQMDYFLTGSKS